jgi:hypothetical protein
VFKRDHTGICLSVLFALRKLDRAWRAPRGRARPQQPGAAAAGESYATGPRSSAGIGRMGNFAPVKPQILLRRNARLMPGMRSRGRHIAAGEKMY